MIEDLGVQGVQFEELLSLDADSLLQLAYVVPYLPFFPLSSYALYITNMKLRRRSKTPQLI